MLLFRNSYKCTKSVQPLVVLADKSVSCSPSIAAENWKKTTMAANEAPKEKWKQSNHFHFLCECHQGIHIPPSTPYLQKNVPGKLRAMTWFFIVFRNVIVSQNCGWNCKGNITMVSWILGTPHFILKEGFRRRQIVGQLWLMASLTL